ncbi:MAG: hypothetical protein NVS9B9_29210 [Ktedonobacteraceae bacterium]
MENNGYITTSGQTTYGQPTIYIGGSPYTGGTYTTTGTQTISTSIPCFQHVVKNLQARGTFAEGKCESCGTSILISSLDFSPFLERVKSLMQQALGVLDTPDDALDVLVTLGTEISADLEKAEEVVDEMRSLRSLCLAFVSRLSA